MAYVKIYDRINWVNKSDGTTTPLGATNLNKIDYAVNELDNRVVSLDTKKAEQSTILNMVSDWHIDKSTGMITVTKLNGEQIMFDLNIEKIPVKFELSDDGILTMTTDDGSVFTANIGAMIPVIVFENSETVSVNKLKNRTEIAIDFSEYVHEFDNPFTGNIVVKVVPLKEGSAPTSQYHATLIGTDGSISVKSETGITEEEFVFSVGDLSKITVKTTSSNNIVALYTEVLTNEIRYKFEVKDGSIKDKHLEPNYLANIKVQAENAELSAVASAESASEAKGYAEQAKEHAESLEFPVSIENGGTGGTTAKEAQYNLLKDMNTESGYSDTSLIIGAYSSADAKKGVLHKKTFATLWAYVKAKAEAIFATKTEVTPVANLVTTIAGKPLDATMGKALGDRVTTVENRIGNCSVQRLTYTFDEGARVALTWQGMYDTTEESVSISAVTSGKYTTVWYKLPDDFLEKYKENQIVSVTLNSNYLMVTHVETFLDGGNLVMKVFNSSSYANTLSVSNVQLNVLDFNNAG